MAFELHYRQNGNCAANAVRMRSFIIVSILKHLKANGIIHAMNIIVKFTSWRKKGKQKLQKLWKIIQTRQIPSKPEFNAAFGVAPASGAAISGVACLVRNLTAKIRSCPAVGEGSGKEKCCRTKT